MEVFKRRIVLVTPSLKDIGGVANYYNSVLPLVRASDFRVKQLEVGSTKGRGSLFYPVSDQYRFHRCITRPPSIVHVNPSLDPKSFIRDGLLVYQAVRRNIPVVVFFHGWDMGFAQIIKKHFFWFFQATFGKASAFIVLGSEFKEKLRAWKVSVPIFTETTVVDPAMIQGFDIGKKTDAILNNTSFRVLFLARIERAKGVFETVDAIKILCDKNIPVSLSIAGDGADMGELVSYVNSLSLPHNAVRFLGYVRGQEKSSVLASHDIYCLPTYYREGLPISALEALIFGMPTITCAVGGLADIFKEGEMGILVPPRDPVAIASAIEEMAENREAMARMAQYNHTYAKENFLASKVAERLLNIYRQILDK